MFCLRASISSDLSCGRRLQRLWSDIYLYDVCAKVYQIWVPSIKSLIGDQQWRLVKAIYSEWRRTYLTGKNGLFAGDKISVNQNIGTRHELELPWTSDWKLSGMYFRELFDTGWPMESSCSAKLIAGGVNCSGQIISLRRFDKVSDEIKPHNVQILT